MSPDHTPGSEVAAPETNGAGAPDLRTYQGLIRQARAELTIAQTVDLEIPGYRFDSEQGTGRLYGTFRALDDYREVRKIGKRHERARDDATRELEIMAETLVTASISTFLRIDGQGDVPLDMRLGATLARWLGLCGESDDVSDPEAVFMIFPDTLKLTLAAVKVDELSQSAGQDADEELAKN